MQKDPNASSRKSDHIELAFQSRITLNDSRFNYEPLLSAHPESSAGNYPFLSGNLKAPVWVSSMTGGTEMARTINKNLARVCGEFGMGMGLGSCRSLLDSDEYLADFDVRDDIGDFPFYANLGVAQVEQLLKNKSFRKAELMVERLRADGLIIHVNPFQEWLQPEGDKFFESPLQTIKEVLRISPLKIIVKEVGQGFGPESLRSLLSLPIEAIEFGAFGGTNFALLEMMRASEEVMKAYTGLANIGHTATEMVDFCNEIMENGEVLRCKQLIISGGVSDFLDGYYLVNKSKLNAVYGQASGFLTYAREDYSRLKDYVSKQLDGYRLAEKYLRVKQL